jgi:serine phosphatase RsbU (regulator of sigma subunit)
MKTIIPKRYLNEFLKDKTAVINNRTQLAAVLFIFTFITGSLVSSLILNEGFTLELILSWIFTVLVSVVMFIVASKVTRVSTAKLSAVVFMVSCLTVLTWFYISVNEAPFNVGMAYIFAFIGFSLMFPWFPKEVMGVLALHSGTFFIYLINTRTFMFRGNAFPVEISDYLQVYIIMFLSSALCWIVSKRERERDIENFVLLKEVEEKNSQMRQELELATRVHSRLVPHSTNTSIADIAVTYVPMYYISGDYAKFQHIGKNKLIFLICDVTGHGVSAALLVNALNAEFESLIKDYTDPGELLKKMDRFILADFGEINMYSTAFCGLLEYGPIAAKLTYSSYGHLPQYIYRAANSSIDRITAQTSFLGLPLEDDTIYKNEIPFDKGDQIVLFTDGVVEAKDANGADFGDERIETFIRENNKMEAGQFNQTLLKELNSFAGNNFKDDVFILNIKTK